MGTVIWFGKSTWERLAARLMPEVGRSYRIEDRQTSIDHQGRSKEVVAISAKNSMGTSANRWIYSNRDGEFFIGRGDDKKSGRVKLGKILSKAFGVSDPQFIEKLCKLWKSYYLSDNDLNEIKVSETLSEIYDMKHARSGTIGSSCMAGKGDYYKNFDDEPNIKIAYLERNGVLFGRAILWHGAKLGDGSVINLMDRIYYAKEAILDLFIAWAKAKGYWRKEHQSNDPETGIVSPDGMVKHTAMDFHLEGSLEEPAPYLDTFRYYYCDGYILSNISEGEDYILDRTDGHLGRPYARCTSCGVELAEDEEIWVEEDGPYCEQCFSDLFTLCECCQDYYRSGSTAFLPVFDEARTGYIYYGFWCEYCVDRRAREGSIIQYWPDDIEDFEEPLYSELVEAERRGVISGEFYVDATLADKYYRGEEDEDEEVAQSLDKNSARASQEHNDYCQEPWLRDRDGGGRRNTCEGRSCSVVLPS